MEAKGSQSVKSVTEGEIFGKIRVDVQGDELRKERCPVYG